VSGRSGIPCCLRCRASVRVAERIEDQFDAARDPQFVEDPNHIVAHGVFAQIELERYFSVSHTVSGSRCSATLLSLQPSLWFDLEHHGGVRLPATNGSPVEVAIGAKDHAYEGGAAISPAREAIEHGLIAGRIDFEHHARARCATVGSSPV
jgi:hypothetical protein